MGYSVILTTSMSNSVYSLQQIEKLTNETNAVLATGKKVNSALDDPIAYFAAQDHTFLASDLTARKDSMGEAIQLIKAANGGIDSMLDLIDSAQSLADSAQTAETTAESTALLTQFNKIMTQITQMAGDSGYKGTNLLGGATETLTAYFNAAGTSSLTLTGVDASATGLGLTNATSWWDTTGGAPDLTAIQTSLDQLTAAKNTLRTTAQSLSMDLTIISSRQDFTSEMITTLSDGASNLTAADTNSESAKLLMLQTQQSLALNSLSIGSDAYSGVLQLFQ
jgi:flagellin-like hook-associated protein FlgL